jgi:lysophospholipase L1-like esterase
MEIRSYVALGDSFTEGLDDLTAPDGGYRGWADRLAERLATRQPGLRYANLAVRGRTLGQVADDQVPVAISLRPDLVSIAAGGNDMLRPGADPDALAAEFDQVISTLQQAGCPVLMFTGFDPRFPVLRLIRGKVAAFNMHLRAIADRHQCQVVDLWSMHVLHDPRAWSADRLHLTADGHRRVALRACEVLGVPVDEDWREPWPPLNQAPRSTAASWLAARRMDARWARVYAAPWVGRRIRGRSSGDGVPPKRPHLQPFSPTPAAPAVLDLGPGSLGHSTS